MRLPKAPGLCFRPLTMEDVGDLCDILQDPETMTAYEHAFSMQEVYTWLGNEASKRVAERVGLRPESTFVKHYYGVDMPHIVYALSRADFYKKAGEADGQ